LDSLKQQLKKDISGMKMLENSMKTKVLCAQNFQILGVYTNQAIYKIYAEDKDLSFIMANEKKLLKKIVECGKKDGSVINCNAAKIVDQLIDGLIGYMSLSLRKMGPDHALTEPEMKALRKGQLEFGALLLKALSTK
jgi:hypothetical protein